MAVKSERAATCYDTTYANHPNQDNDALSFDPTDMRMWLNWGRDKAKEVVTESPFN